MWWNKKIKRCRTRAIPMESEHKISIQRRSRTRTNAKKGVTSNTTSVLQYKSTKKYRNKKHKMKSLKKHLKQCHKQQTDRHKKLAYAGFDRCNNFEIARKFIRWRREALNIVIGLEHCIGELYCSVPGYWQMNSLARATPPPARLLLVN